MTRSLDYLVVGHVTRDLVGSSDTGALGGTATFSSITARDLGCRAGVLTAASGELPLHMLDDIKVHCQPSVCTTTFENIYPASEPRRQLLHQQAATLSASDVPAGWLDTPIVHLGPVFHEIDDEVARLFVGAQLLAVTPQGWMRRQRNRCILPCRWQGADQLLPRCRVAILSREDVGGDLPQVAQMVALTEIVVLTAGREGATVFYRNEKRHFAAPSVVEVDPTGAGDIFAAAYLVQLWRSGDPWQAATFANDIAADSVTRDRALLAL